MVEKEKYWSTSTSTQQCVLKYKYQYTWPQAWCVLLVQLEQRQQRWKVQVLLGLNYLKVCGGFPLWKVIIHWGGSVGTEILCPEVSLIWAVL